MRRINELNLAFVGVSHWHVPLYLRAVKEYGLKVVAVSDTDPEASRKVASDLGCGSFTDMNDLLEQNRPDFVFAFGRHCDMPGIAKKLISLKIPFAMEKPIGLRSAEVRDVLESAVREGVSCSIPFIWRYSDIVGTLREHIMPEDVVHMSFTFIAGPPGRYLESSPWMLERKSAGGGCMTNLGVHFIDLALFLSGSRSATVDSSRFHYSWGYDVEDYAVSMMTLDSGATLSIETGYAYPTDAASHADNRWTVVTKKGFYSLGDGSVELREFGPGGVSRIGVDTDADTYYPVFVHESLKECVTGSASTAGLDEMLRVRTILDDIIRRAGEV